MCSQPLICNCLRKVQHFCVPCFGRMANGPELYIESVPFTGELRGGISHDWLNGVQKKPLLSHSKMAVRVIVGHWMTC